MNALRGLHHAMNPHDGSFEILPFPRMWRFVTDFGWISRRKHMIRGLLEVDVTEARRILRDYKASSGESISFTAFLAACLGQAVEADKRVQAQRDWRGRLMVFEDVDVGMLVERHDIQGAYGLEEFVVPRDAG